LIYSPPSSAIDIDFFFLLCIVPLSLRISIVPPVQSSLCRCLRTYSRIRKGPKCSRHRELSQVRMPGGEGGVVSTRAKGVKLVVLDMSREFTGLGRRCGGTIGKACNKICVVRGCATSAHRLCPIHVDFPSTASVFIPAQGSTGDGVTSVFVRPFVAASDFGETLETYLHDDRPRESWETLLCSISKAEPQDKTEATLSKQASMIENNDDEAPRGVTPLKKHPKLEVRSPALDAGF
jgi:hypothetical protein